MQYLAAFSLSQNHCFFRGQVFKLVCISVFFLLPIAVFPRTTPIELQECETNLLNHQPEAALQCLNEKRPAKLSPTSRLSVAWLELWLDANLKYPRQMDSGDTKQLKEAINLAIQWLGSPKLETQSKKRLSNLVYQHLNAQPSSVSASMTSMTLQSNKNHLLLAFMALLSFCILSALFIINRYYFNSPEQEQKVLQQHVKERNQALIQQYSRLQDYSIANSHLVRAPLARLLGLVELMKDEPLTRDGKFYLQHIAQSCEELDEWVMKMNTILDPETNGSDDAEELSSLNHFLSIEK